MTPPVLVKKIIAIVICLFINIIISRLLYELIMELFKISTDGFMNLNGIYTIAVIWVVITATLFVIAKTIKERLGTYYKTIRITQIILFVLPFLIVLLFMVAVNFK